MEIILGAVMSREFLSFCFYNDAVRAFDNLLSNELLSFKSDLVETISIRLICLSSKFSQFFRAHRPK